VFFHAVAYPTWQGTHSLQTIDIKACTRMFYICPEEIVVYRHNELLRHTTADFLWAGVFEAAILI
jgi:hypothetical protein